MEGNSQKKELVKQIRKIAPKKIYLACDGPIENDMINQEKVFKTREILNKEINWDCEIKWQISDINLGLFIVRKSTN